MKDYGAYTGTPTSTVMNRFILIAIIAVASYIVSIVAVEAIDAYRVNYGNLPDIQGYRFTPINYLRC